MQFNRDATTVQAQGEAGIDDAVVVLEPDAHAPSLARTFVADHRDHLSDDLVDDAQLLVSELVSNAVVHGRSTITLRVWSARYGMGVAVADTGVAIPEQAAERPRRPQPGSVGGRGMAILDAVANSWGVVPTEPPPGKTVWFELHAG